MQFEFKPETFFKMNNGYYINWNNTPTQLHQIQDELLNLEKQFGSIHRLQRDQDRNIF